MQTIFTNALWISPLFWTLILLAVAVLLFVRNKCGWMLSRYL